MHDGAKLEGISGERRSSENISPTPSDGSGRRLSGDALASGGFVAPGAIPPTTPANQQQESPTDASAKSKWKQAVSRVTNKVISSTSSSATQQQQVQQLQQPKPQASQQVQQAQPQQTQHHPQQQTQQQQQQRILMFTSGPRAVALYDFQGTERSELKLIKGQSVAIRDEVNSDWLICTDTKSESGLVPVSHLLIIEERTKISAC